MRIPWYVFFSPPSSVQVPIDVTLFNRLTYFERSAQLADFLKIFQVRSLSLGALALRSVSILRRASLKARILRPPTVRSLPFVQRSMATAKEAPKSFAKRDALHALERQMQERWSKEKIFEQDAPAAGQPAPAAGKYMATFPYPYMNGRLHLGHTFTFSKAEFATAFQRLMGKHALLPFAFHCLHGDTRITLATGVSMRIKDLANLPQVLKVALMQVPLTSSACCRCLRSVRIKRSWSRRRASTCRARR